ncbi:hypothetical protein LLE87_36815, partial [Paenibacillus polymyxa]|nr:hypothetical protein [Paenibacillus polymyxa]
ILLVDGGVFADKLRFVLREGKKRQIRRMCELVGLKVIGLKRVRIGRVALGDLPLARGADFNAQIVAQSRFSTPEQFRQVILR